MANSNSSTRHPWSKQQVRTFVSEVRKPFGSSWAELLTGRLQQALIAEHAFYVVRTTWRDDISVQAINALYDDMMVEAGLRDEA